HAGQNDGAWCLVLEQPQGASWQRGRFMGRIFQAEMRHSTRPVHPDRPEQLGRPDSGHPIPVQSNASVKFLNALLCLI
ncbi:MAG: hypothetical protein EBV01_15350, partial [Betaproteobacteria bacterium]|nr:hypothetical protein [Betaproteobacteria bacterium]